MSDLVGLSTSDVRATTNTLTAINNANTPTVSDPGKFLEILQNQKASTVNSPANEREIELDKAAKAFEAMLVTQFMGEFFKESSSGAFGDGIEGEVYSSMFANAVAEKVADSGGFGFAEFLKRGI